MKILNIKKKKLATVLLLLGIALIVLYMGIYGIYNIGVVEEIKKVTINTESIGIKVGSTYKLSAIVYPSDVSSKKVTWKSSDEKIAKVNSDGVVSGVKSGTATITATSLGNKKITDTVEIVVGNEDVILEAVNCKQGSIYLELGYNYLLEVNFLPYGSNNIKLNYTSSNEDVVSINEFGLVKGITIGKSTITVKDEKTGVFGGCDIIILNSGGEQGNS